MDCSKLDFCSSSLLKCPIRTPYKALDIFGYCIHGVPLDFTASNQVASSKERKNKIIKLFSIVIEKLYDI